MPVRSLWEDVRGAILGESHDYTTEPLGRAILVLAVPMVLEMSMQSLFSVADVYFVGKLGSSAVSITGLTDALLMTVFAIGMGLGMGTTAMVARRVGEGKPEEASRVTGQAILLGVAVSGVLGVLGGIFAGPLLAAMGATPEMIAEGKTFTTWMLAGNGSILLLFLINAAFRGAGQPSQAMAALFVANALNIVLDPLLIFGIGPFPELGLTGAAIATVGARFVGVGFQILQLRRDGGALRLHAQCFVPESKTMARLVRISAIGMLQFSISTLSFIGVMRILSGFGEAALAGYTIAVRVIIFILLPSWGLGNAAATLVGQNLGAGHADRAEAAVWKTARANTVFMVLVMLLFLFASPAIAGVFSEEAGVVAIAVDCLRIIAGSYVFWGFGAITVLAFNGAGDTTTPTWINLIVFWAFMLPLAWALAMGLGMGPRGVFWSLAVAHVFYSAMGVGLFRKGRWKRVVV